MAEWRLLPHTGMLKYGKRCHRAEEEREGQSTDPARSQDRNGMENDANLVRFKLVGPVEFNVSVPRKVNCGKAAENRRSRLRRPARKHDEYGYRSR